MAVIEALFIREVNDASRLGVLILKVWVAHMSQFFYASFGW